MNCSRNSVGVLVVVGIVVGCAQGEASTRTAKSPAAGSSKRVIANRPIVYALPDGCAPSGGKFQCNPVTNEGCDRSKNEACDDDEHDGFGCYPGPNAVEEGGECNDEEGPSCRGGLGCDSGSESESDGICRHYCCSGAECGSKRCVGIEKKIGTLGFCK